MEPCAEVLERLSAKLGCSPVSRELAAELDRRDELGHLRQQFLLPKVADLPPCECA